jgi:hypothetical protein
MTTAGSVIEWKWSVEASGWRPDYDARGYVESVSQIMVRYMSDE